PQTRVEPKGEPGVSQQVHAKLAGTWTVEKTFSLPNRPATKTVGEAVQTMTHGGRFLQCEVTFDGPAGKTTGTGVIGFDPATGRFTRVWYDSRQTKMSFRQSKSTFDGAKIVLEAVDVDGPPARQSRTETTLSADGGRIVHRQFNPGTDGSEHLLMELVLTRKPATRR
ncbi:MAG: DUF1579 family protein, partial [Acidimicrobiales bacterium]|nr:DUF1579 family protein [Acidimicrobiales bacterium]